MKKGLIILAFMAFQMTLNAQSQVVKYKDAEGVEHKLQQYYVVFLMSGENRTHDKATAERIQNEHIQYLTDLWKQGKIILNGPFDADTEMRGMSIYKVDNAEMAKRLAEADPAVRAGRLKIEVHPWWSAPFDVKFED
jgi:uncharacterized protein